MFLGTHHGELDKDFLKQIDNYPEREVYAKIISLNWDEQAIAEITGNIQSGNISVDGSSSTRRTCSLTIVTDQVKSSINSADWGLKTKFAVLIGLRNYISDDYDDIIWFQQGVFIITSFSQNYTTTGLTVSIQGKDKMCLLDGTVGGTLFADHDFGAIDVINDDGTVIKELITIQEIIKNAVHTYALEPYENIIINDIDDAAVELLNYRVNDTNLFIYDISPSRDFTLYTSQMTFDTDDSALAKKFKQFAPKDQDGNYRIQEPFQIDQSITGQGVWYRLIKYVTYGETVGYRETELTYAGDLVVDAGGAVSAAFDSIINMLGEFEYYYDIYGRFIFQRKKIYHNIAWNGAVTNEGDATYYDNTSNAMIQYEFNNGFLISSYINRPNLTNIKNDFVIWGTANNDIPIHLRYAIDERPISYTSLSSGLTYVADTSILDNTLEENIGDLTGYQVILEPSKNPYINIEEFPYADFDMESFAEYYYTMMETYAITPPNRRQTNTVRFTYSYSSNEGYTLNYEDIRRWRYTRGASNSLDGQNTIYYISDFLSNVPSPSASGTYAIPTSWIGQDLVFTIIPQFKITQKYKLVDWRELIYRMAEDNSKSQGYIQQLTLAMNRTDAEVFKRYRFDAYIRFADRNCYYYDTQDKIWKSPETEEELNQLQESNKLLFGIINDKNADKFVKKTFVEEIAEWQTTWNTGYDNYYADMQAFWRLIYDCRSIDEILKAVDLTEYEKEKRIEDYMRWQNNSWWNPDLIDYYNNTVHFTQPEGLIFWIDFIGAGTELEKYKASIIGRRAKVVNDSDVKAILFKDTPEVLFVDPNSGEVTDEQSISYVRLNLTGGLANYFTISGQGKSAKDTLDNLVYEYTYYQEQIQLTTLPVYYLEPNMRISVYDDVTGINGDYIVKSFNYSFAYDGTMSITANRIADRII